MNAKLNYLKQELTSLKSQLAADDKSELRKQVAIADQKIKARELLGLEPDRAEAEAIANLIDVEVGKVNAKQIGIKNVNDFMGEFDAAIDPPGNVPE